MHTNKLIEVSETKLLHPQEFPAVNQITIFGFRTFLDISTRTMLPIHNWTVDNFRWDSWESYVEPFSDALMECDVV